VDADRIRGKALSKSRGIQSLKEFKDALTDQHGPEKNSLTTSSYIVAVQDLD